MYSCSTFFFKTSEAKHKYRLLLIIGPLDNNNLLYIERDIHEHSEEYDEFSKKVDNDFIPSFMLLTLDENDDAHNVKLCAPERDFDDIFEGVEIVKEYFLD